MTTTFTLEYWRDDDWYVGQMREVPGVFSQGKTLSELEENIREVYQLMLRSSEPFGIFPSVLAPSPEELAWLRLAEPAFQFWDNPEDAAYDAL
ncbi:MAG: type II toxin-antitoxin system HicB family antitoxin [Candidatus Rokuibacteriota bacterium]